MKTPGVLILCLILPAIGLPTQSARADDRVDYARQIKPVLQSRCYACHGVLKQKGDLRLDTASLAIKGGRNQPTISPGEADASVLLDRISSKEESERMPPEGEPLKPTEIAAIRTWIAQGAKSPADEQPERDPRDHWAFKTPVRPPVPAVANAAWVKNPIDAFITAEQQKRGLTPQPPADKRVWLRRVTLDLVGLPPTLEELQAFVNDNSVDAYEKVVTRLLDSPQYGERWGRHWMDIWRYSDWWGLGAEVRNSQKHIWHWRDWIIESLNADKGYDQMLREMLAADELYPNDLDRLRASGFLARQYFKFNRTSWLDETIEHTSKSMLGLTFNCGKCHDHKYDPFSQVDYYKFRAIFDPYQVRTDLMPGETDLEKDGLPRAYDCNLDIKSYLHVRGDDRNPDKTRTITPAFPAFLSHNTPRIEKVALPAEAAQPGLRSFVLTANLKLANDRIATALDGLKTPKANLAEAEAAVAKAKAAKSGTASKPPAKPADFKPTAVDDFAKARPELWTLKGGAWAYENNKLVQSRASTDQGVLSLKRTPPQDFEARLRYRPTGGNTWKSVGITFDRSGESEVNVYLSSYAGGPKAQVSYKVKGVGSYPAEGAEQRPVELNQPHELLVKVHDTLVNVSVDGKPSVAYRLPIARQSGSMELFAFDVTAEFLAFELRPLATDTVLVEPGTQKPVDPEIVVKQAKLALTVAEKYLKTAEAQPASINARWQADLAKSQARPKEELARLVATAVKLERAANLAKSDEDLSRSELDLLKASPQQKATTEKALAAAKTALASAQKAVDSPGDTYTSITGSVKTFESNLETEESRRKPFPTTSTGRRTALAQWITDPKHPLPARVAVNHIWARHFGKPLVPTVFDFGRKGTPPTHPELLDWLAVELVEHQWSMKHIHRLIVTSNTYRLASTNHGATAATLKADPDNRYYWRANPIRIEAQLVRDALLSLSGELDLTRGGPSIPVSDETSRRRSLYFVHSHNEHNGFLSIFDDASVLECYRRAESIVPQQALALENSPLASAAAEKIARRIAKANPKASDRDFVRQAFSMVLAVEPTDAEMNTLVDALPRIADAAKRKKLSDPSARARVAVIQALLNHNDFVTVR